jgi:hypothetical protein
MTAYRCSECGELHDETDIELAFRRPDAYFQTPLWRRWWKSRATSSLCLLSGKRYFVRGILELPVTERPEPYGLGMWAEVTEDSFYRYVDFHDSDRTQPFVGELSGSIANHIPRVYADTTLGIPVTLHRSQEASTTLE